MLEDDVIGAAYAPVGVLVIGTSINANTSDDVTASVAVESSAAYVVGFAVELDDAAGAASSTATDDTADTSEPHVVANDSEFAETIGAVIEWVAEHDVRLGLDADMSLDAVVVGESVCVALDGLLVGESAFDDIDEWAQRQRRTRWLAGWLVCFFVEWCDVLFFV